MFSVIFEGLLLQIRTYKPASANFHGKKAVDLKFLLLLLLMKRNRSQNVGCQAVSVVLVKTGFFLDATLCVFFPLFYGLDVASKPHCDNDSEWGVPGLYFNIE